MELNKWYKILKEARRMIIRERKDNTVEREDVLLQHIEEFKQKAKELQDMMGSKENRVKELQGEVDEKEHELYERELAVKKIEEDFQVREDTVNKLSMNVQNQLTEIVEKLNALTEQMGDQKSGVFAETVAENGERIVELQNNMSELSEGLQQAQEELGDKVHTENVKGYRNIKSLMTTLEANLLTKDEEISKYNGLRNLLTCTTFVSIGTFIVVVMLLLSECGVI